MFRMLTLAGLALAAAVPAAAQDTTAVAVKDAIDAEIAPAVKKTGEVTVSITGITWADPLKPGEDTKKAVEAGAGISNQINRALSAHNIQVVFGLPPGRQPVELHGLVCQIVDAKSGLPANKLILTLTVNQKKECVVSRLIFGAYWIDGVEVLVPPKTKPAEVVDIVTAARKCGDNGGAKPQEQKKGPVWNSADGTVGLELAVADTAALHATLKEKKPEQADALFTPREHDTHGGVAMKVGESWRAKLVNRNDFAVIGELKVCGVDWSEGNKLGTPEKPTERVFIVVPAKSERTIKGWLLDTSHSLTFDSKELPAAVAGRQADNVGVVQFTYRACWKKGETPPTGDEPDDNTLSGVSTGKGVEQADKFELVERVVGKTPRGSVKVRYGTVGN